MDENDEVPLALGQLRELRQTVLWKVDGLDEAQLRRPLTPTGTNLLGLVKHLAADEFGYFQLCFGRPVPDLPMLADDADPQGDFQATEDETADGLVALYREACAASDRTVAELGLAAVGRVPWWGGAEARLDGLVQHMVLETSRHAGQMDILREQLDGQAGYSQQMPLLPTQDPAYWQGRVDEANRLADRAAAGTDGAATRDATG